MLNLDTHILIFLLSDELTNRERALLRGHRWGISAIVLWELAKLVQLGRRQMDLESEEFLSAMSAFHLWPIDLDVSIASTRLDFRADPADEIIAATSVVHRVPLLTRDRRIRRSRIVPLA